MNTENIRMKNMNVTKLLLPILLSSLLVACGGDKSPNNNKKGLGSIVGNWYISVHQTKSMIGYTEYLYIKPDRNYNWYVEADIGGKKIRCVRALHKIEHIENEMFNIIVEKDGKIHTWKIVADDDMLKATHTTDKGNEQKFTSYKTNKKESAFANTQRCNKDDFRLPSNN